MKISAKSYRGLDVEERVSLILAARARGNDQEEGRIARSSPRMTFTGIDRELIRRLDVLDSHGLLAVMMLEPPVTKAEYARQMLMPTPTWLEELGDDDRPTLAAQFIRAMGEMPMWLSDFRDLRLSDSELETVFGLMSSVAESCSKAVDKFHSAVLIGCLDKARSITNGIRSWSQKHEYSSADFIQTYCDPQLSRIDAIANVESEARKRLISVVSENVASGDEESVVDEVAEATEAEFLLQCQMLGC